MLLGGSTECLGSRRGSPSCLQKEAGKGVIFLFPMRRVLTPQEQWQHGHVQAMATWAGQKARR